MMRAHDEFRRSMLEGLYADVKKGTGTDLEVSVPREGAQDGDAANMEVFHLHLAIVASGSRYFAAFPEPKTGRAIKDIDSKAFAVCLRFLYLGEWDDLSHENVASVMQAAAFLQIDALRQKAVDYLEDHLDHANYEQVLELSDRYDVASLRKSALRFESRNSSRDELVAKRLRLARNAEIIAYEADAIMDRKKEVETKLRSIEEQLKDVFISQHEKVLLSNLETMDIDEDQNSIPYHLGSFNQPGSVGHLVHCYSSKFYYKGSSTYGFDDENRPGDDDDDDDGSSYSTCTPQVPPPPTEEHYRQFGIVHAHDLLSTAIKAAKPGDRLYLTPGVHYEYQEDIRHYTDARNYLTSSIEFIGLCTDDKLSEVIIDMYDGYMGDGFEMVTNQCFEMTGDLVGFYNIKFRSMRQWHGRVMCIRV